jgi:hypothetical protein
VARRRCRAQELRHPHHRRRALRAERKLHGGVGELVRHRFHSGRGRGHDHQRRSVRAFRSSTTIPRQASSIRARSSSPASAPSATKDPPLCRSRGRASRSGGRLRLRVGGMPVAIGHGDRGPGLSSRAVGQHRLDQWLRREADVPALSDLRLSSTSRVLARSTRRAVSRSPCETEPSTLRASGSQSPSCCSRPRSSAQLSVCSAALACASRAFIRCSLRVWIRRQAICGGCGGCMQSAAIPSTESSSCSSLVCRTTG